MTSEEIRSKFISFFEDDKRGRHTRVPSSPLIPDDPSVLFTTAGMQQFKVYYTGEADVRRVLKLEPGEEPNVISVQKCFRTSDIDEVGDGSHLTFFQMLGNFSFGGYFKEESIRYAHQFLTEELGLHISHVTVFGGDARVPRDEESVRIWRERGVTDIREAGREDNFWGPTGASGPCGPTTEIYCKNKEGEDIEVWNLVFNEYFYPGTREELLAGVSGKSLEKLKTPGVDTGMGLERLAVIVQGVNSVFDTDLFSRPFGELPFPGGDERTSRIVADHIRASVFLLADGVLPFNKEQGYVLRRLIRRSIFYAKRFSIEDALSEFIDRIIEAYGTFYPELKKNKELIRNGFQEESRKFSLASKEGRAELDSTAITGLNSTAVAFKLYQSYGIQPEQSKEWIKERGGTVDEKKFEEKFRQHQEVSRAGQEKKFGGHGLILDTGELKASTPEEVKKVIALHTATHLLHQALRDVLGTHVHQMGSDITAERLRFDFSHPQKLTSEEIKKVEEIVNEKIHEDLAVSVHDTSYENAIQKGALAFFKLKYPSEVHVYSIGAYSKEVCGGPHVEHTGVIGLFRIIKEESSSAGVRRIRAVIG